MKVDNEDSTQDMIMMFNVLDDPDTQQKEELILKALHDLKEGGFFVGSHLVEDYRDWDNLIIDTASKYGFELHSADVFPPSISGGTPFAFRLIKKPVMNNAPSPRLRP